MGLTRRIVAQSLAEAFNRRYNLNIRLILLFGHEVIFQFIAIIGLARKVRCQGIAAVFDRRTKSITAVSRFKPGSEYLHNFVPHPGCDLFVDPPVGEHFDPVLEERG